MIISISMRTATLSRPPESALPAFGEKLRKQREQRGMTLEAVSDSTKISTRLLRALEADHFDQLPGGVFNKGFVRAYARQVGLDEEEALADYLTALRESQMLQQSTLPDFRAPSAKPGDAPAPQLRRQSRDNRDLSKQDLPKQDLSKQELSSQDAHPPAGRFQQKYPAGFPEQPDHHDDPSAQIPWGKLAVALLLVTFALVLWNSRRHAESSSASHPAAAPPPSPAPIPVSAPVAASTQSSAGTLKVGRASPPSTLSAGTLSAGALSARSLSSGSTPSTSVSTGTSSPPTTSASLTLRAAMPASSAAAPSSAASSANPPLANHLAAARPPNTFTLLIRAEKTTWISITADGKPVAAETLIAPAHTSVRATAEIVIKAGNAAGVSFQLNGKEIPPQGNEGEVKTYVFDPTGLREAPPAQTPAANH
jgi:hypothetical protein